MRKPIIAGNWKMNKTADEAVTLCQELVQICPKNNAIEKIICPTYVCLDRIQTVIKGSEFQLGGQNIHEKDSGAYTGEISGDMLKSVGCTHVIIGHSERRQYFQETDETVNTKIKKAFEIGLTPIMCIGESLEERESNQALTVIEAQLTKGLNELKNTVVTEKKEIIIAYEPIWAIGTGKVATPEQAEEVHQFIREKLTTLFSKEVADTIRILYGGSVKAENATELMGKQNIDGALVGGASLKADAFIGIIENTPS